MTYFFTPENATRVTREAPRTTLTQFFVLNQTDEFARTIFYHQVPTFYAWQTNKTWKRRVLGNEVPNFPGIYFFKYTFFNVLMTVLSI